jgi:hypothetical protein
MNRITKPVAYFAFAALLVLVFFASVGARTVFNPPAPTRELPQIQNAMTVNGCISFQLTSSQNSAMLMACPAAGASKTSMPEVKLFDCGADACVAPAKPKVIKTI